MKEGELHVLLAGLHVGRVLRLAPLYDLGSALPYPDINQRRLKLAMKLGSTYRVHDIGPRDFSKLAGELQLDEAQVLERARQLVRSFNEALPDICQRVRKAGLEHGIIDNLAKGLATRAKQGARVLAR